MPNLSDILNVAVPAATTVGGGLLRRRSVNNAVKNLSAGADTAVGTINSGTTQAMDFLRSGADKSRKTLADVYADQKKTLTPFVDAGMGSLDQLTAGLKPGGEYNTPFDSKTFDLFKDPSVQWRIDQGRKALEAERNATGTRFSGDFYKELEDRGQEAGAQEWQAAFNRYQADTTGRYNRQMGVEQQGQNAATTEVQAGSNYGQDLASIQNSTGTNLAKLQEDAAAQIADLQTQKASAEAAGDIQQANTVTDTINGILKTLDNAGGIGSLVKKAAPATLAAALPGAASIAAPAIAPILAATGGAGTAVGTGTSLASILAGGVPEISATSIGVGAPGSAALAGTSAASGGSIGTTLATFFKDPVTIAIGAAIIGGILWKRSQIHNTANTWTQQTQTEFGQHLSSIVDAFDKAYATGQLDKASAAQAREQVASLIADVEKKADEFAAKGGKQKTVISQFRAEMAKDFGQGYSGILGKMDSEIAGMA